jgi:hypothetical protein
MSTDDFNFLIFNIIVWGCAGFIIFLFYLLDHPHNYKNFDYKDFKPKYDHEKAAKIWAEVHGFKTEDEKPKQEPIKKSLWDCILEAIGL